MLRSARSALIGTAAAALTMATLLPVGSAQALTTWSSPIKVASSDAIMYAPVLAMSSDGTKQYMAWQEQDNGTYRIKFARSTDSGESWEGSIWVSGDGTMSVSPSIACSADGSRIMITWLGDAGSGTSVFMIPITQGGDAFGAVTPLSSIGADGDSAPIVMSRDGLSATVGWSGYSTSTNNEYVNTSSTTDGGDTWSPIPTTHSATVNPHSTPALAASAEGSKVYVTWQEEISGYDRIFFASSTDSGANWSSAAVMNPASTYPEKGVTPFITSSSDGQTLHLAWIQSYQGSQPSSIPTMTSSTDGGASWGAAAITNVLDLTNALNGLVASVDGNHVSLLVMSDPGATRKAYVVSTDSSSNWATTTLPSIMETGIQYFNGAYSADGSLLAVTWETSASSSAAANVAMSTDHGTNWSSTKSFTTDGQLVMFPMVAASTNGSLLAVSWRQFLAPTTNKLFVAEFGTPGPIAVDPTIAAFGRVPLKSTKTITINVTNTSAPNATLADLALFGTGVTVSGGTCAAGTVVKFDEGCTVEVSWRPKSVGKLVGSLTVTWNGTPDVVVPFTGVAVRAAQALSSKVTFPASIKVGKPMVLVKKSLSTTSGQAVTPTVRCAPAAALRPAGDSTLCDVRVSAAGKVTVTAAPTGTRVVLTLTAPGTKKLRPFAKVVRWSVK